MNNVQLVLEARYPGLYGSIVSALVDAEAQFNARTGQAPSEFLLDLVSAAGYSLPVSLAAKLRLSRPPGLVAPDR